MMTIVPTQPETPRRKFHASLSVRTTLEQMRELEDVADQLGVSVGDLVRVAITKGLQPARRAIVQAISDANDGATPIA